MVWSRRQPLACVGAVLSLLDGSTGCDPAFCVVWFRFRLLRRFLALWRTEVGRVYRLLEMVGEGCPGHGPVHLHSASAAQVGFRWNPHALAWSRPGLLLLSYLAGLFSISGLLFLMLGVIRLLLTFTAGRAFEVGLCWIPMAPCSSLTLLMFEKGIRLCFVASWLEVFGIGCFLVGFVVRFFHVGVVGRQMVMVIFLVNVPFLLLLRFVKILLIRMDKGHWPRCLLWHGWLPVLSGVNGPSPWAAGASESASDLVEAALRFWYNY